MEIPADFRDRVYKIKMNVQDRNPKILDEIRKKFPDAEIGALYEVRPNLTMDYILAVEFEREEDYTAFMLIYGGDCV
jgi:hypothetical protein